MIEWGACERSACDRGHAVRRGRHTTIIDPSFASIVSPAATVEVSATTGPGWHSVARRLHGRGICHHRPGSRSGAHHHPWRSGHRAAAAASVVASSDHATEVATSPPPRPMAPPPPMPPRPTSVTSLWVVPNAPFKSGTPAFACPIISRGKKEAACKGSYCSYTHSHLRGRILRINFVRRFAHLIQDAGLRSINKKPGNGDATRLLSAWELIPMDSA